MKVMVMYNVCSEKMRAKIINLCLDYGLERIQKSVYLGELSGTLKRKFFAELKEYCGQQQEDRIRVFEFGKKGEKRFAEKEEE